LFIGVRNVLFWTEQAPEGGLAAELSIDWPLPLELLIGHAFWEPMWERRPPAIFGFLHDPQ
jgi:hypothetical protein